MQVAKLEARPLIHLSVAIGRFVEALFYAILRVAGMISGVVIAVALAGFLLFMLGRRMIGRKDRER
ncbi:MAG: hypothetical protein QM688_12300 [Sphingomonas bacterium]